MTNQEIENTFTKLVASERKITREVLMWLIKIEDRKIHLESHGSLYDYLVKKYKYSNGAASRRIAAAKLLRAVPEIAEKIQNGDVNLSSLAQTQTFIKKQNLSKEAKLEVIEQIENQNSLQVEKTLSQLFPEAGNEKNESLKRVSETKSRLSIDIDDQLRENLEYLRDRLAHSMPEATNAEILLMATEALRNQLDPARKPKAEPKESSSTQIPRATYRHVMQRDKGMCQWETSGKICGSRYQVQVDHILARALGGSNDAKNLRCLCRNHNQLHAERTFGAKKANEWRTQK